MGEAISCGLIGIRKYFGDRLLTNTCSYLTLILTVALGALMTRAVSGPVSVLPF